ncbi:LPS assembly lipoprotein LptE [Marimonas arenosa]|uniref:LPS assembly lipoprotein LptE n=1 Tax=Marimonas arenosa TaxID=1795305 RepID=A0AAE4B4T8_9RHOB|nr:LPS assembly lipoprotein LptE [Marimonas arenosa]MDQ2090457.1 LPS assembly lipoprotein LptE [Marimonas arenosa]
MWLSDRRAFLGGLMAVFGLVGCGFTPLHAPGEAASRLQGRIVVDAPVDRNGYLLVRRMEERLGRSDAPAYGLSLAIDVKEERMAISADNITTRFNVIGRATYALRDLEDGKVLMSGTADSFTGYSATGSTVATQAAERDAYARLMTILADQIVSRLTAQADALPS